MQIAFWSTVHGQTATTSNTIALTLSIALNHNYKLLIGHSHASRSTMEKCFIGTRDFEEQNMLTFSDHGIDALTRLARNGRLSSDIINNYTTPILSKCRLDMLMGTTQKEKDKLEEHHEVMQQIFTYAKQFYDIVTLDVHSGLDNQLTRTLLKHSNLIVVCLNQNKAVLEDFNDDKYKTFFKDKKIIVCLGMYSKYSKQSINNIMKQYKLSRIITVPYNIGFQNGCNDSSVLDYFIRNMNTRKTDDAYDFFKQVKEASNTILSELDMLVEAGE